MAILRIWDEASQSYQEIPTLVGPQGPAGQPGQDGADGAPGEQGPAGPNEMSTSTDSSITGLLKGASGKVAQAVAGEDYEAAGTAASAIATHNAAADAHSELLAGKANTGHTQAASTITAGTLAGQVVANSSGQTYSTSLLRNSRLVSVETAPTVNGEICWTYE